MPRKRVSLNRRYSNLAAWRAAGERQECDIARALDGYRYRALVTCASAKLAAWLDLSALTDVASESSEILVINVSDVIGAVLAHLAAGTAEAASTTAATATWAARTSALWSAATLGAAKSARTRLSIFCVLRISHFYLPNPVGA